MEGISMSVVKRGFVPSDEQEFSVDSQIILRKAQQDVLYLLEQGYPIKNASTFVGNHYMLSERQRIAIARATTTRVVLKERFNKQIIKDYKGRSIAIDGLNQIITLEVALSFSTLILCMDGVIRDLAGLRGTYRIIDKTEEAIRLIGDKLSDMEIKEVLFYLDAPVSNTGRLKQRIQDILSDRTYTVTVELVNNADVLLQNRENVITGDAIILNQCLSWINLTPIILKENLPEINLVNLSEVDYIDKL